MSWEQLVSLYRAAADELAEEEATPPAACPHDGQPLETGPRGELWCPFDGYVHAG